VTRLFAIVRTRGPAWDDARGLEQQDGWTAHADFMDALADEGFVALAGPLEGTRDALIVVRAADPAEIAERLSVDPWTLSGHLVLQHTWPWQLRIGSLEER
jgi:hypothetical protein